MNPNKFMSLLCKEFEQFVHDSMEDGMHEHFPDHLEFLSACMEVFTEMKDDGKTAATWEEMFP